MIDQHIVNIGFPKTGTDWLWSHAGFGPLSAKENRILMQELDFDKYIKHYSQYRVSANFQTNLWHVDREIINFVHQHATHITIILRNPFDFVQSYFDWIYVGQEPQSLLNHIVYSGFMQYRDIVDRWNTNDNRFQMFFFDDLENNPFKFFQDYMAFCQIPVEQNKNINYNVKINANRKTTKAKLKFSADQVNFINNQVDRFQPLVNRDLTHWKR